MGKMGKKDGRPGKSLENPLNMLKNFRVEGGGGRGIKHGRVIWNIQFYFILGLNQIKDLQKKVVFFNIIP